MSKSVHRPAEMQVEMVNYRPVYDQKDDSRVVDHPPVSKITVPAHQIYVGTGRIEYGIHFTKDDELIIEGPDGDSMFLAKIVIFNGKATLTIDPPPYVRLSREDDDDVSGIGG